MKEIEIKIEMIRTFNNMLKTGNVFFNDIIHTSIGVSILAKAIIDTSEYQRLRELHQLGVSHYVFPNANHTRFEHSIGVYHLVGIMLQNLVNNSTLAEINKALLEIPFTKNYLIKYHDLQMDSEESIEYLKNARISLLDAYLIENIKIAGLVHDLGHCAFSHMFDSWLHKKYGIEFSNEDINICEHEVRSVLLFKQIVSKYSVNFNGNILPMSDFIDNDSFNFIADLINPSPSCPSNYIYQIVSNPINGLDVDKLDYLKRDSFNLGIDIPFKLTDILSHVKIINGNICYPREKAYGVFEVYNARYVLHKQYYNHPTTKLIEFMMRDIFDLLDPVLKIYESFKTRDLDKIITFTDVSIISACKILKMFEPVYTQYKSNIDGAEKILTNINNRKLYTKLYYHTLKTSDVFNELEYIDNQKISHLDSDSNLNSSNNSSNEFTSIKKNNSKKSQSQSQSKKTNLKKMPKFSETNINLSLNENLNNMSLDLNEAFDSINLTQTIAPDNIEHEKFKIGLLGGNDSIHPIEKVHFYDSRNNCINLKIEQISNLISRDYQEVVYVGYQKN